MDIGVYIADLLRIQEEVSLPGLGTFAKKQVAGSYDQINNTFKPPSFQISFTDKLSDFNTLSEYISFKKNLSLSSAEYFVKKFSSSITELLQSSGIAEVKPLGMFRQQDESLTFEAFPGFEVTGKFYGLKPIVDLRNLTAPALIEAEIHSARPGGSIEDFINSQGDEEIGVKEVYVEETRSNRTWLIISGALFFTIIAAALFYLFNPQTRNLVERLISEYRSTPPAVPDSGNFGSISYPVITDSVNTQLPVSVLDSGIVDSVERIEPVEKKEEPLAAITTIEIIGAAFGKRKEAELYIENMKKKGLQARILEDMPGPLFKVSLASFPDLPSAKKELIRIKKDVEKDAWPTPYKSKKTQ